jgi:hypothetical protein
VQSFLPLLIFTKSLKGEKKREKNLIAQKNLSRKKKLIKKSFDPKLAGYTQ